MADLIDFAPVRILTTNALPGAGYLVRFYESGTTTPVTVYTDEAVTIPHSIPLAADASGVFATVWASGGAIKAVIADTNGATVYTVDPVQSISSGSGANEVTFAPTAEIPVTNVQDAIERVQANIIAPLADFGLGVTGSAPLLAGLDATNIASGAYRFDGTTTGTYPTGVAAADTGIIETWRETAGSAMMIMYHDTTDRVFHRRMASSAWGAWREVVTVDIGATEGDTLYRTSTAWARLAKGTAGQALIMNAGATAPSWGGPFTKSYPAAGAAVTEQTITSGGLLTVAHGMGVAPTLLGYKLICKTTEDGWAVNDVIEATMSSNIADVARISTVYCDATNIYVRYSDQTNVFAAGDKTAGTAVSLTNTNWRLIIRAWA